MDLIYRLVARALTCQLSESKTTIPYCNRHVQYPYNARTVNVLRCSALALRQRRYDIIKISSRSTTHSKVPEARRPWHSLDADAALAWCWSKPTNKPSQSNNWEVTLTFNQCQTTVFAFTITRTIKFYTYRTSIPKVGLLSIPPDFSNTSRSWRCTLSQNYQSWYHRRWREWIH